MNGLNLYITVSAVVLGILSALLNFTGRQKYKDNASFFESSNHELREQNSSLKEEKSALTADLAKAQAESTQKDAIIEQLKPFTEVVKLINNNQKEIVTQLSDLAKKITAKVDGNARN